MIFYVVAIPVLVLLLLFLGIVRLFFGPEPEDWRERWEQRQAAERRKKWTSGST